MLHFGYETATSLRVFSCKESRPNVICVMFEIAPHPDYPRQSLVRRDGGFADLPLAHHFHDAHPNMSGMCLTPVKARREAMHAGFPNIRELRRQLI